MGMTAWTLTSPPVGVPGALLGVNCDPALTAGEAVECALSSFSIGDMTWGSGSSGTETASQV